MRCGRDVIGCLDFSIWVKPVRFVILFLFSSMTLFTSLGSAQAAAFETLEIESFRESIQLDSHLLVLEADVGPDSVATVLKRFQAGEGLRRSEFKTNRLFGKAVYWLAIQFDTAPSIPLEWVMDTGYPKYLQVDWFLYGAAEEKHKVSGSSYAWSNRDYPIENIAFATTLKSNTQYTALVRIQSDNFLPLSLWLLTDRHFQRKSRSIHFLTALVLGLFVGMLVYNFFIYLQTRDELTGLLSVLLLCATCYFIGYRGLLAEYILVDIGTRHPSVIFGFPGFFLTSMMAVLGAFIRRLLNLEAHTPKVDRIIKVYSGFMAFCAPLWFFPVTWWTVLNLVYLYVATMTFLIFWGGVVAFRQREPVLRLFILAQTPVLVAGINVSIVYNGDYSSLERTVAVLISALCVVVSVMAYSMIIGNKFNEDRKKRFELQENMTEQLEVEVEQRTTELAHKTLEAQEATLEALKARDQAESLHRKAERQAKELEVLSQAKSAFFQNISHELRTPLTLILNPLESLAQDNPGNKHAEVALKNSRRLLRLVNQLLDYQKLDAGKKVLSLQPLNVSKFITVCQDYFTSACSTKKIEFYASANNKALALNDTPYFMNGDLDALEKITFNYLSNALKYTPPGGQIELGLCANDGSIEIFVRDTGPGISPEDQSKLFQVFSQVEESTTREYEGTGLGLALAKSLADEMNGRVGVRSEVGKGSCFWASFPDCDPPDEEQDLHFEAREWLLADGRVSRSGAHQSLSLDEESIEEVLQGTGELVLVVDDLADMRELVVSVLTENDYRVVEAKNGREGYELACRLKPNLIISDWMMPKMSGPQLINAIRSNGDLASTPVVLLTAKYDEESKLIGKDIGADAFLGKPFNKQELTSTVRNMVSLKRREHEVEALNRMLTERVLKRYLPPDLVEQIIDGSVSIDQAPENIVGTVIFSDLVGFTALSGELGADRIARLLNDYLTAMVEVIYQHGGTIDKFIGDAVMVVFGAPKRMEPQGQVIQAVQCAHAMQARLGELNQVWKTEGMDMQMRIGIHHGPVVAGTFGSVDRSDYTVIGPTVNMASRIESKCLPGQVYASEEVCEFLPKESSQRVNDFELKGIQGKVPLYRLV